MTFFMRKCEKNNRSQLLLMLLCFFAFYELLKGTDLEVGWVLVEASFFDTLVSLCFINNLKGTFNVTVSFDNTIFAVIPSSDILLDFKNLFSAIAMFRFIALAFASGTVLMAMTEIWLLVGRSEVFRQHGFLLTQSQIEEFSFAIFCFLLLFLL
jgi:hypothetical protein